MWSILFANALAGELAFTPDRPGVGDSTGTVGGGHFMLEGGLALVPTAPSFGTSGVVGRLGLDDGLELRLRVPDVVYEDGVTVGPVGLGGKVAGAAGERWSASVVPEVLFDVSTRQVAASVSSNLAFSYQKLGIWGNATASADADGVGLFMGGGASVAFAPVGIYANGGYEIGAGPMAGAGGWVAITKAFQVDFGCDVYDLGKTNTPVLGLGLSVGV